MSVRTLQVPTETDLVTQVQRAAEGHWQAAAWLLANGPLTRAEWSSREPMRQALQQQRRSFLALIDQSDLTADQRTVLLQRLASLPLEPEAFDIAADADDVDLLAVAA